MEKKQHHSKEEALKVTANGKDIFQDSPVTMTSAELLLSMDLSYDFVVFGLNVRVVGR